MAVTRRILLASSTAALAAPALLRAARGEAPYVTLNLHHALSSVSCAHANFLVPWARKVEAQSGGRIRVDIFPSMQLGGRPGQLFDQARDGFADIVWTMPSKTPGRFPKIELFELPFVPPRRALVGSKALEDFSAEYLTDEFRDVHPICFSCADRGILHGHRPIESLAQMAGLRLDVRTRCAGEAVQALGARAMPMPSGQLPLAIGRHVVDGCVLPWDMVPALRVDELLTAHTDFADYALSTTTYVLAMNKAAYQRLPAVLRKVIDANSGQTAASMAGAMWDLQAAAVAEAVSRRGGTVVTLAPQAVVLWRHATVPVIDSWMKQMKARKVDGAELLASAHTLFEKYAGEPEPQPPALPRPAQANGPPAQTRIERNPPAKVETITAPPASNSVSAPAPPTANPVAAPAPHPSVPTPPASAPPPAPAHWWQFWKSAAAPSPVAPSAPSPTPVPPSAPAPPPVQPPVAAIVKPAPPPPPPPPPLKTLDFPL